MEVTVGGPPRQVGGGGREETLECGEGKGTWGLIAEPPAALPRPTRVQAPR